MTAPYEIMGPDRKQAVDLLLQKYQKKYDKLELETIKLTLEQVIPEKKTDFGSWRGWSTFGLEKDLVNQIEKKLDSENEKIS